MTHLLYDLNLWSNLLSGLIGALLGAAITYYIHHRSQFDTARQNLLAIVYQLGYESYSKPADGKPELPFREHYRLLWVAYSGLRRCLLFPWSRKSLDKAWHKYAHMEFYDEIPD
jgi:hypothetical protein